MKRFFYLTAVFVFMSILAYGQNGQFSWVSTAGGSSSDYNYGAYTDAQGNTYVTGKFKSDPMDFGNGVSISTSGNYDIYVAKYDANGVAQWAVDAGSPGSSSPDEGRAVTVDANGYVYVTGAFFGTAYFSATDSLVSTGNFDIFIAKYDNDGNFIWAKQAYSAGGNQDKGTGIVTDADGNVYVTGYWGDDMGDTLFYDGTAVLNGIGDRDMFVMKIDGDGNFQWAVTGGNIYKEEAKAIDVDEDGNVYVTGHYDDTTGVFGSTTLPYVDDNEVFIIKLDGSNGNYLWAKGLVGNGKDGGNAIEASVEQGPDNGIVLVAGYFNDDIAYDANTMTSFGDDDILLSAFDKDGSFLGMAQFGGDGEDKAYAVNLVFENIYIGGYSKSDIIVGTDTLTNYGRKDALLIKFNGPNDELVWIKNYGGNSDDYIEAIGEDEKGNIYPVGYFKSNPASFDPIDAGTAGSYDLWVGRMNYTGPIHGVFFSEYIEGSSYNKALEIYNGTGAPLDMSNFIIKTSYNGSGWQSDFYTFPEGTVIDEGDVWVIANDGADSTILAVADDILPYNQGGYVMAFNGDDARGLFQVVDGDTVLLDVIGIPDEDPGSGWDVAGVTNATKDHTLVRKSSACDGTDDWAESAGTDADNSQWIVYDKDTFNFLGSHSCGTPTNVNVTFQVDMSVQAAMGNFDPATHTVSIPGSFNGWDTGADMLSDPDGDLVYSVTLSLEPNMTYEYKYFAMGQWESVDNRSVTTGESDMILDPVYFNDVDEIITGDASVTFEVDMRLPMRQGSLNPGQQVFVAGSFNGWSTSTDEMTDDDGDSTYTVVVENLQSGEDLQFKFIYYKTDGSVEWEGIDNRHFTPAPGDTNHFFAFWNDIDPDVQFADGDVTFNVDMSVMSEVGIFDNVQDSMMVRGSFNGWGDQDVMNQDPLSADFYFKTISFEQQPVGMDLAYKFYVKNHDPNTLWTDGWERPFSQGGGNRNVEFAGETGQQVDPVYYDDVDPDWVIEAGQTVQITFAVDMTDAADPNIQVPTFNPATDTVWWIAEQPSFVYSQGWTDTDNMRVLALSDDDGDMVYTGTLTVNGPAWNGFEYRYAFTHDGGSFTHEPAGFSDFAYRVRYLPMTGARQFVQPYTAPQDHWTPQEDKSDQWEEGPVVGVEDEAGIVKKFDLQQNYPNPFNPTTTIKFSVPKNGMVTLKVYNLLGQEVATLVNGEMNAGSYKVTFDASKLGSGVYFYKLQAGNNSATKKMILLK